jgi:hypothetical protein
LFSIKSPFPLPITFFLLTFPQIYITPFYHSILYYHSIKPHPINFSFYFYSFFYHSFSNPNPIIIATKNQIIKTINFHINLKNHFIHFTINISDTKTLLYLHFLLLISPINFLFNSLSIFFLFILLAISLSLILITFIFLSLITLIFFYIFQPVF